MPIGLADFKDLLEAYFLIKNIPEKGNKQGDLDDIKMEIYDGYLNENFERNSSASPFESKVMREFFMEVDKQEQKYMKSAEINTFEMAKESNGHALTCAIEFTQDFKRFDDLLKPELRSMLEPSPLMRGSSKKSKSKKSKSKKRKSKKRKSKKRKYKKRKSKKRKSKKLK